ncbi:DUF4168 domain-containing protein [Marinobacter sp. DUT-1]|uniref:DUF4168 domain-containing protein n=1 Tax=Marinobacter sp. DUT-1 TaxID=3412037 RepID=UPI003D1736A5
MNRLFVSCVASIALATAIPVFAQQPTSNDEPVATESDGYSNPEAAGTQKTDYSDTELRQFIEAQARLMEVRKEYIEKIESADSEEKANQLQMKANDRMLEVIRDSGMDVPTYNAIATAYNSEPKVRNRVDALM